MRTFFRYIQSALAAAMQVHDKQVGISGNDSAIAKQRFPGALSFRTLSDRGHL